MRFNCTRGAAGEDPMEEMRLGDDDELEAASDWSDKEEKRIFKGRREMEFLVELVVF